MTTVHEVAKTLRSLNRPGFGVKRGKTLTTFLHAQDAVVYAAAVPGAVVMQRIGRMWRRMF